MRLHEIIAVGTHVTTAASVSTSRFTIKTLGPRSMTLAELEPREIQLPPVRAVAMRRLLLVGVCFSSLLGMESR